METIREHQTLQEKHLKDLQASGLREETIRAAGFYSASADQTQKILGFNAGSGLSIPYPATNGEPPFIRIKPDQPFSDKNGKIAKYLTRKGAGNRLYIPPSLISNKVLSDPTIPLLITEGEKKALKATQEGVPCVALAGVWSFVQKTGNKEKSTPIPDLDKIHWNNRTVFICYDSDLVEKESVAWAEWKLAHELQNRKAKVRVIRLPDGPNGQKVGLDDFLLQQGSQALQTLIDGATPPEPPKKHLLDDPIFVEPALAIVGNKVLVTRMMRGIRVHQEGKSEDTAHTYEVWKPRIITSEREIIEPPPKITKDPREIIPLGGGLYLRAPLEDAKARWSLESIKQFTSGKAKAPDVEALYHTLLDSFKEWCYIPDESTYHLLALHVLGSYFFELFPAYPYINLNGPPGSGKTTTGQVAAALGFNGILIIDPSQSSLFRMIDREKPYLVIDEKENAASRKHAEDDPGFMTLLKSGYQRGARITRQNPKHVEITEYFSVYSPKLICNVHGLEDILQDRSILVITQQAPPGCKIRGHQPDPENPCWQAIRDQLYLALMFCHEEIKEVRTSDMSGQFAHFREKELFKPLIDLALWVDSHGDGKTAITAITEILKAQKGSRAFTRSLTPEEQFINALRDLLGTADEITVHTVQIIDAIKAQSTDALIWCNEVWIGKAMRRLNIWRTQNDNMRARATIMGEGGMPEVKMLKHYRIKKDRLPAQ